MLIARVSRRSRDTRVTGNREIAGQAVHSTTHREKARPASSACNTNRSRLRHAHLQQAAIVTDSDGSREFRALFISDVHLGTRGCQAEALLDFLRDHDAET